MTAAGYSRSIQGQWGRDLFHDRHINPQIYAQLNGQNWSLKDYEAAGGYQALRKILGKDGGEGLTQVRSQRSKSALRVVEVLVSHGLQVELHAASVPRAKYLVCNRMRVSQVRARTGNPHATRTS